MDPQRAMVKAASILLDWCWRQGIDFVLAINDIVLVNKILVSFVQFSYDHNSAPGIAVQGILAVQTRCRFLQGKLKAAWNSVSGWKLSKPIQSRVPIPARILDAMCNLCCIMAFSWDVCRSYFWMALNVALRTGYHALCRPKELIGFILRDLKLPSVVSFKYFPSCAASQRTQKQSFHGACSSPVD